MRRVLFAAALAATLSAAEPRTVALTFDDLPLAGEGDARRINRAILDALARHRAPAIGFVNGSRGGQAVLREWIRRGQELGNHTFSHPDLNDITVDRFRREVIDGEAAIPGKARFLRFPFNHTGDTREKHDAVAAFLAGRGYRVAPCTIDNSDYLFARAYEKGNRGKVRAEYLSYTAAEIDYYTQLHKTALGREIPHVMLLHVNRLNADVMDKLLRLFEDRGYRFVTLEEALADPAYAVPDTHVTQYGPMWGYRWAAQLGVRVNGRIEPQPPDWILSDRTRTRNGR